MRLQRFLAALNVIVGLTAALAVAGLFYRARGPLTPGLPWLFALGNIFLLSLMILHVLTTLLALRDDRARLHRALWVDALALAPAIAFVRHPDLTPSLYIMAREGLLLFLVILRPARTQRLVAALGRRPACPAPTRP